MAHFTKWVGKVPQILKFTGINSWKCIERVPCYNCNLYFKDKSVFIPRKIHSDNDIEVYGNFCSFNCATRFIDTNYSDEDQKKIKDEYLNSLKYLYFLFYNDNSSHTPHGIFVENIPLAPPKEVMKKYGGDLSEEEYRQEIKRLTSEIR